MLPLLGALLLAGCATNEIDPDFARAAQTEEQGLIVEGPAEYCGSAAIVELTENERIKNLFATGLSARIFTFVTHGQRIDVAEADNARNVDGTLIAETDVFETRRVRIENGDVIYVLQAVRGGGQVRLASASFTGSNGDLPLVQRFSLRAYREAECSNPARLF